ncbi:branched-chain-amino-acid aminotransferase [bacterium BMS3Abin07]|nr:branched-chain-amino-acid aminotransferase [bacterium BMS3Abin07]GBE32445.1 branched-chain-amino-acid aminotransferase [bacterium BMS3Bbin05]HDL20129.1 branched-chain-amino-acid transaminase [Nitrospirota bacterium]HDO23148.1 branched-chain-amino-acid transaminase [Nitrospirota bacterium]HDZ87765.1 branched-chain-amino-acid transaminase [Nitrospirota bacterium]
MKIYIDGKYYSRADARIPVFDHGLLYGDGVFEGIRIYNGNVFRLREHIERLYQSAKALYLKIPVSKDEMEDAVLRTVEINKKANGYIRLIVTRGEGPLGIDPFQCKRATVIIIVADIHLYPEEYYKKGIEIITASTRRMSSDCLDPRVKSLNYLNNVLAKIEARQAGCLEAIMLNRDGFVAECTGDNIFIVKDGELLTPSSYHGALDGITMRTVMEIAESLGITTCETTLTRYDLYNADECFLSGTGAEIVPVVKIDGRVTGSGSPGAITKMIMKRFILIIQI